MTDARVQVGIEIGGTFTDVILVGPRGGMRIAKVPTTAQDLTEGAIDGFRRVLEAAGCAAASVEELLHGSTIATNALIERKGARVGLITTAGFEDLLLIGRQERDDVHDMFYRRPPPLVRRRETCGVGERIAADGSVLVPLDAGEAEHALRSLVEGQGVVSLAVCLLHAYRNPVHERVLGALAAERFPELDVSLSCEVVPEHREYERASTTVLSAYVSPVVRRYLARLEARLSASGYRGVPLIMQSNGGVLPARAAAAQPARMYLSGPAAGVTGASYLARAAGIPDLLTMDIGGTSCDVSLIGDGEPGMTSRGLGEYRIHGQPLNLVMMDIIALGAGGGSIARLDAGGMLQVGPESAGADPGPACYGSGGEHFTLTDALLLLGLIEPAGFADGRFELSAGDAKRVAEPLAARLGIDALEVARNVHRISVVNVARGLRLATVERGRDPRDYALCAYGGAGPLLAAHVAEEVDITRVVVPPAPGVFSAFGLCVADMRMDFVRALPDTRAGELTDAALDEPLAALGDQAGEAFAAIGIATDRLELDFAVDARYAGQGYELRVGLGTQAPGAGGGQRLAEAFHAAHAKQYGHSFAERAVELVNLRLAARSRREVRIAPPAATARDAARGVRPVWLDGEARWSVHEREELAPGTRFGGPALVVEETTTTVIPPGWTAGAGALGMLDLRRDGRNA